MQGLHEPMGIDMIQLYNGDCLEVMKQIPDKSVAKEALEQIQEVK